MRTAYTLHVGFKVYTVRRYVCSVATHAVGGDAGYCLLWLIVPTGYLKMKMPYNEKAACTLEVSKCRLLFFWECMVGIYAYAGAGCLKAKNVCATSAHPTLDQI